MLGLTKREIEQRFDEIVEFAELRDFIDAPVKTYSSGMYMRLGFAVAIHVDPDVLLVDEVLAVGDEGFTHKCLDKFAEFKRRGKTILLVTHSLGLVERFCDEAVWLDAGRKRAQGDPEARRRTLYITDVERQEEQFLAASDERMQQAARDASPTSRRRTRRPIRPSMPPSDMSQGRRRPLGIGRGRDHRSGAARRRRASRRTCFETGDSDARSACACSASRPVERFRVRRRHLQRRRRLRVRHEHRHRGVRTADALSGDADVRRRHSTRSISSKAPTSSTSPCTSATARRTTTIGCCTRSGSSRGRRTSASIGRSIAGSFRRRHDETQAP